MRSSLAESLFLQLAGACAETRRCFDRYVGMSQAQRQLLAVLKDEGEVRHAWLQQRLGVDGATVTRLVKRIEADGTVARRLDPADNRYTLASLTPAGEKQRRRRTGDRQRRRGAPDAAVGKRHEPLRVGEVPGSPLGRQRRLGVSNESG